MTVTEQSQTAWPEGVIARYLTAGGTTVDLTETGPRTDNRRLYATVAACTGCSDWHEEKWRDGYFDHRENFHDLEHADSIAYAEQQVREWAQAHAEKCRAMSRPEGN